VPEEGEVDLDPAAAGRWLGARDRFAVRRAPKARRRVLGSGIGKRAQVSAEQRILILDSWLRSKLPAHDFSALVGVSPHTLYAWKKRFELEGPAGLEERPRGAPHGSRLPEATRRAILLLKQTHPSWGQDRIHDVLMRTRGCGASPGAIGRVLEAAGFASVDVPTTPHPPRVTTFERERPNELWQTDLFTFVLKREARRVHLVAFMDDHSRFIVGYGLHASASGALVREVFEAAIANYGAPTEVLTDNGTQYHTWRGKSDFAKLCERRGIRQIVASPRRPQTLGKIERFWGTLWRECAQEAIFRGLEDARRRIGLFIDHYNFQRTHSGIAGLVPADRYFAAADEVRETLRARVNANALDLARHGLPRKSFYLTGRVGDQAISLHAEGERVVLCREDGTREEVDLGAPGRRAVESEELELAEPVTPSAAPSDHPACVEEESDLPVPASSELDSLLDRLEAGLEPAAGAGAREGGAR
jgi:transposase InsO family protein